MAVGSGSNGKKTYIEVTTEFRNVPETSTRKKQRLYKNREVQVLESGKRSTETASIKYWKEERHIHEERKRSTTIC